MNVFLSWSGELSHKVACGLRDWLPSVLQFVKPYVSSEDIDKGARWSTDIAKELQASEYGILVITSDNQESPWICFEAGALSKQMDKSHVSPFLVNLKRAEVKNGPLLQFQSTIYIKEDVAKLIESINNAAREAERLEAKRVKDVFDVWWPILQNKLDEAVKKAQKPDAKRKPRQRALYPVTVQNSVVMPSARGFFQRVCSRNFLSTCYKKTSFPATLMSNLRAT